MTTYAFASRVPKSCIHDKAEYSTYLMNNPNLDPYNQENEERVEPLIRGEREWRNAMRARDTAYDLTGNPNEWPDYYVVTRCDFCDAEKIKRWNEMHWQQNPWERQRRFVQALAWLECHSELTAEEEAAILEMVHLFHLTRYDFKQIDEYPNRFGVGVDIDARKWHWKLRQVRNRTNGLFDILLRNEDEGNTDENTTPKIPLMLFNNMD